MDDQKDTVEVAVAFDEAAFKDDSIPVKYQELMGLAAALVAQCPHGTRVHFRKAREAGATERELSEASMIAAAVRRGARPRWGGLNRFSSFARHHDG